MRKIGFPQICFDAEGASSGGAAPAAPAAAPAAAAPSGGTTPAAGEPGGGPSAAEILAFDPFAPPSSGEGATPPGSAEPKTPAADATATGGAKPQASGTTPTPAPGATPATATPATPAVPATAPNLEQLFREQTDLIRQAVARPAAPDKPAEPDKPRFNLAIPPQILAGMRSEDPNEFATSMHSVINGIANHLWGEFNKHLETTVQPQYQSMIEQHIESLQTRATVAQDFYGANPNLNVPALRPIIQQAGLEVAKARLAAGKSVNWSPELAQEIADSVYAVFPQLKPAPGTPATGTTPPGTTPAKPRFVNGGGGPRPAAPSAEAESEFGADLLKQ